MPAKLSDKRDEYVDFVRGLAILDMLLVHYSKNFPSLLKKIIIYHDIAIEGFIFIAGLMVGKYYFKRYQENPINVTYKIFTRILKLFIIQYMLIFTASLPQYIITNNNYDLNVIGKFLVKSVMFYNQIGLIHILPTFIPLFFLAPIILFALSRGYHFLAIIGSGIFFAVGQFYPYLFNYGEKTIFPVILWQIYFVMGCYAGRFDLEKKLMDIDSGYRKLILPTTGLFIVLLIKHSTSLSPILTEILEKMGIQIEKFPLNIYGLMFGVALWFFVLATIAFFWKIIDNQKIALIMKLFGKYSLLFFVIHVYFAKSIEIISAKYSHASMFLTYFLMIANMACSYWVLLFYDKKLKMNGSGSRTMRIVKWIFG